MSAAPSLSPVQRASALHRIKITLDPGDPFFDLAAVGFDLRFARPTQEAKTAALTLQMGPGADEPALLVSEMRMLDLKRTLARAGAFPEYFKDERAYDR